MVNRVFLILGVAGAAASLAVHLGAWLGAVAGCDVTFLLFSGYPSCVVARNHEHGGSLPNTPTRDALA